MSAESAGFLALAKWLWGLVLVPFMWRLHNKQDKLDEKINTRYTKDETDQAIELRVDPLKQSLDNNTEATKELSAAITDLRVRLAESRGKQGE